MPCKRKIAALCRTPKRRLRLYPRLSRNSWNPLVLSIIRSYLKLESKLVFAVALCSRVQTDYESQSIVEQLFCIENWLKTKVYHVRYRPMWDCHDWTFEVSSRATKRDKKGFAASLAVLSSGSKFDLRCQTSNGKYNIYRGVIMTSSHTRLASLVCGFVYTRLLDSRTIRVSQKH